LEKWFRDGVNWSQVSQAVLIAQTIYLIYLIGILGLFKIFNISIPIVGGAELIPTDVTEFFVFIVVAAIIEEFLFRFLPLAIMLVLNTPIKTVLIVSMVVSVLFGINHASVIQVFIQGVSGFVLSLLFLKVSGTNKPNYRKAYFAVFLNHFIFKMLVFFI